MWSCNKKGLAIFSECQRIRLFQFTPWGQQILRERKILLWLETKLRCILNRGINHLACQLKWAFGRSPLMENSVMDLAFVISAGITCPGKRIFEPQAILIYQVDSETDITIRLLPSHNNLYKSRLILLPLRTDQTLDERKVASTANNGLHGQGGELLSVCSMLCSSFLLATLFHERFLIFLCISWHIFLLLDDSYSLLVDIRHISNIHPSPLPSRLQDGIDHCLAAHAVVERWNIIATVNDSLDKGKILIVAEGCSGITLQRIAG